MTPIILRSATLKDLSSLLALEELCFAGDRLSLRSFKNFIATKKNAVLILEKQQALLGAAIVLFAKRVKAARLYSFAIHPEHRKQGLAERLLKAVINISQQKKYLALNLEVREDNLAAINFYQKHGFKPFGFYHQYYQDGSKALRMRKLL